MSAAPAVSVAAAGRDALPASAAASVAPTAGPPAAAASPAPPLPTAAHELAAVQQRIADVEEEIKEAKEARKACARGSDLWIRADDELKQLREKEAMLLKEKERKELALEREDASALLAQQLQQLQLADQQRRQQEDDRRFNLVRRGFPPLGDHVCSSSSAAVNKLHPEAQLVESPFFCLADPPDAAAVPWLLPPPLGSDTWNVLENSSPPATRLGAWSSESDIHGYVRGALLDVIKHSGLQSDVSLLNEVSIFHPAKKQQYRADIWVVRDKSGFPIGVCEVKKPNAPKAASALAHPLLHGQIFDYMVNLRNFFGLKRVFGVISTYEEWRICWLADTDEAARETNAAAYVQRAREEESRDVAGDRTVHATPIFRHDNPELVLLLVHLLHKMHLSPYDASPKLVKPGQRYPLFTESAWDWTPLEPDFRLSYCMPHANTKHFYMLQQYHGGADGLVWLAASAQGNLVVLKFGLVGDSRQEVKQSLEAEAQQWNALWGCKARVVQLFHRLALVMPFAFHAHMNVRTAGEHGGVSQTTGRRIIFTGPNNWTAVLSDAEVAKRVASAQQPDPDVVREDKEVLPLLADYLAAHSPEAIAQSAIAAMLEHGVMHADLCWRHVALLPSRSGSQWTLRPVLIDLTRVRSIHTAAGAAAEHAHGDIAGGASGSGHAASEDDKAAELQEAMVKLTEELERI